MPKLVEILKPHAADAAIGAWIPGLGDARPGGSKIEHHILRIAPYDLPDRKRFAVSRDDALGYLRDARRMTQFIRGHGGRLPTKWWGGRTTVR